MNSSEIVIQKNLFSPESIGNLAFNEIAEGRVRPRRLLDADPQDLFRPSNDVKRLALQQRAQTTAAFLDLPCDATPQSRRIVSLVHKWFEKISILPEARILAHLFPQNPFHTIFEPMPLSLETEEAIAAEVNNVLDHSLSYLPQHWIELYRARYGVGTYNPLSNGEIKQRYSEYISNIDPNVYLNVPTVKEKIRLVENELRQRQKVLVPLVVMPNRTIASKLNIERLRNIDPERLSRILTIPDPLRDHFHLTKSAIITDPRQPIRQLLYASSEIGTSHQELFDQFVEQIRRVIQE